MVKEKEMMCQEALANVLNSGFSHGVFSIGYDDDAVCLEKDNNSWEVYIGYRGIKRERLVFDNIIEACIGVIKLLTPANENLRAKLNDAFANSIISPQNKIV